MKLAEPLALDRARCICIDAGANVIAGVVGVVFEAVDCTVVSDVDPKHTSVRSGGS